MTAQSYGEAYVSGFDRTVRLLVSRGAAREGAVEAAQMAWTRGWEKLNQLRDESALLAWINSIALNAYRNLLRKQKLMVPLRERDHEFELDLAPIQVQNILRLCGRRERRLLELQMLGMTAEEMAGDRGTSKTAMRLRLMRARLSLRRRISAKAGCRRDAWRIPEKTQAA